MGIFINIFPVYINNPLNLFEGEREKYPSINDLRKRFPCNFYVEGNKIYAYGGNSSDVLKIGFKSVSKYPKEIPKTTCRMILEGFCDKLSSIGYAIESQRFITRAFDIKNPVPLSVKEVLLLNGCEYRTVYLKDILTNTLIFGLIIDLKFKLEFQGNSCSYSGIRKLISEKYDSMTATIIREIKVKTGDLTPTGKMNAQASQFRYEGIMNIMKQIGDKITLPNGNEAIIATEPTPIIMEA
ncbi:MAG: hypothetical protein QXW39_04485 [Candidatus Bathyarchaeia archaeon]